MKVFALSPYKCQLASVSFLEATAFASPNRFPTFVSSGMGTLVWVLLWGDLLCVYPSATGISMMCLCPSKIFLNQ